MLSDWQTRGVAFRPLLGSVGSGKADCQAHFMGKHTKTASKMAW
jgi:hypothetical protein